jgi:hypothetical protein
MIIPAPPVEEEAAPPSKTGAKPAGAEAKAPAEGAQNPAPAPPASFWEKFKRRLKFW